MTTRKIVRFVIDVGNTSITSAAAIDGEIIAPERVATSSIKDPQDFIELIKDIAARTKMTAVDIVACIGVQTVREFAREASHTTGLFLHLVSGDNPRGALLDYDSVSTLGPDRIANSIAAQNVVPLPGVIVDCGTAITIDYIDAQGTFEGGAIMPGIETSRDALTHQAPVLPAVDLVAPKDIVGRDTVECIQSGVLYGAAAIIDTFVRRITHERGSVTVILTGGNAALLQPLIESEVSYDEFFTLRGLALAEL